ncbi:MAG: patatin-like phospholipase family protein [Ignavibacteriae bacterium]|nr:patatin-like phospholipase family protein [Ignavibacteriota bacterium]
MANALILSGGSIRGAFQAGAIREVLKSGFKPDNIYGISVGSLNGTFLTYQAGKKIKAHQNLDWAQISDELINFWKQNIKKSDDVAVKRKVAELVGDIVNTSFRGLTSTDPIKNLIHNLFFKDKTPFQFAPNELTVGAVNMMTGGIEYANPASDLFEHYLVASTAIPLLMPIVSIPSPDDNGKIYPFTDGGIREVAPTRIAMGNPGNDKFVCICCQPTNLMLEKENFDYHSIFQMVERTLDILVDEVVENDIFRLTSKFPETVVIRPEVPIPLQLESFTSADIASTIELGAEQAKKALQGVNFNIV